MANLQDYHNKYVVIRDVKYYITEIDIEAQLQSTITAQEDIIKRLKEDGEALIADTIWDEDIECSVCPYCRENDRFTEKIKHTPTCPITLHTALMSELEKREG